MGLTIPATTAMAFTEQQTRDCQSSMDDFLARRRPPENVRDQLDLSWRIVGQSVVIFTIRPVWNDPARKIEQEIAKATYVATKDRWNIFWKRSDMKWHTYDPHPEALLFDEFPAIVDEDASGCFWG